MRGARIGRIVAINLLALTVSVVALALAVSPAMAENLPGWELNSHSYPTDLPPGGSGLVEIDLYNIGGAPSTTGATLMDTLPAGVEGISEEGWTCTASAQSVCTLNLEGQSKTRGEYFLPVNVASSAPTGATQNLVSVSGGGALGGASATNDLIVDAEPAKFGFADADAWFSNADGTVDTQAGSHPYDFTFNFALNSSEKLLPAEGEGRKVDVNLPPGLIGDPNPGRAVTAAPPG